VTVNVKYWVAEPAELVPVIAYIVALVTTSGLPESFPVVELKIKPFVTAGEIEYLVTAPPVVRMS
jgi:hypothetical protein